MARGGFRIFDSDTHVGPSMNILDATWRRRESPAADWEQWKDVNPRTGRVTTPRADATTTPSRQRAAEKASAGYMAAFTGANRARPSPRVDEDPAERIRDMIAKGST